MDLGLPGLNGCSRPGFFTAPLSNKHRFQFQAPCCSKRQQARITSIIWLWLAAYHLALACFGAAHAWPWAARMHHEHHLALARFVAGRAAATRHPSSASFGLGLPRCRACHRAHHVALACFVSGLPQPPGQHQ